MGYFKILVEKWCAMRKKKWLHRQTQQKESHYRNQLRMSYCGFLTMQKLQIQSIVVFLFHFSTPHDKSFPCDATIRNVVDFLYE